MIKHDFNGLSESYRQLRDVEANDFGIEDIRQHVHRNMRTRKQTLRAQLRVRKRWEHQREALHERLFWSPERMRDWQLGTVSRLVDFAYNYVPFYHRLYKSVGFETGDIVAWADFEQLPVVTKAMLVEGAGEMCSSLEFGPETSHIARTSGSSGLNLTIVQDDASVDSRVVLNLRQTEIMVGSRLSETDYRYSIYLASERFTSLAGGYPVLTVSQNCPPEAVARHLALIRPRILYSFPSYLKRLVAVCGDLSSIGVSCISTNSEASTNAERQAFAEHFGVPVFDEYSSEEFSLIAVQCDLGRYHLIEDNLYAETAGTDGNDCGVLVGTSFANTHMPFIRYLQGDTVGVDSGEVVCGCGSRFRVLESFQGRSDQFLVGSGGKKVASDILMGLYDSTLIRDASLKEFQIVQRRLDLVAVSLVPVQADSVLDRGLIQEFVAGLHRLLGDVLTVSVNIVQQLPAGTSHKRRLIINEMGA